MKPKDAPVILPQCRPASPGGCAAENHRRMVAEAAYYRAKERGFVPGHELEDWLAAERELAHLLLASAA